MLTLTYPTTRVAIVILASDGGVYEIGGKTSVYEGDLSHTQRHFRRSLGIAETGVDDAATSLHDAAMEFDHLSVEEWIRAFCSGEELQQHRDDIAALEVVDATPSATVDREEWRPGHCPWDVRMASRSEDFLITLARDDFREKLLERFGASDRWPTMPKSPYRPGTAEATTRELARTTALARLLGANIDRVVPSLRKDAERHIRQFFLDLVRCNVDLFDSEHELSSAIGDAWQRGQLALVEHS